MQIRKLMAHSGGTNKRFGMWWRTDYHLWPFRLIRASVLPTTDMYFFSNLP